MTRLRIESGGTFTNASQSRGLDGPSPTILAGGLSSSGLDGVWLDDSIDTPASPSTAKPPFRIPSMDDVRAMPRHGLTAVSTFSGGGGSCTGYRMAGWTVAWASEFEPTAAATYAANHPDTILDTRDIRTVTGADITAAIGGAEVDLLDGSPPCQSFSTAGQRSKSWGKVMDHSDGTRQRSDDLFWEFIRLVDELRPRTFVAENVHGLITGVAKGLFKRIMANFKSLDYRVEARVLDAQWLGVPQARKRVFIVGVRPDLDLDPAWPVPLGYRYSMLDACPWLGSARGYEARQGGWAGHTAANLAAPVPTVQASQYDGRLDLRTQYNATSINRRPLTEPSYTVCAMGIKDVVRSEASVPGDGDELDAETGQTLSAASRHGPGRRRLTIAEVRRLCGFPDDYVLTGTYEQRWARLGNSVPPPMAKAVGQALAAMLA